jgi:MerR family transcriptional regulator, light-induced transcriptional regulator
MPASNPPRSRPAPPKRPKSPSGADDAPQYRSGAVARMLQMPVATLRVWERRYGLSQPALSPSGQRLYAAEDVRRLALLKQLTDLGHAIGRLAALDMAQLQQVAATHAQALAATQKGARQEAERLPPARAWRVAVVGAALGRRLQRPALLQRLGAPLELIGPFDSPTQAAATLRAGDVDTVLVHEPHLHEGWLRSFNAALPSLAAVRKAVLYAFAPEPVCDALAEAGTALLREPQPDAVLVQWLRALAQPAREAPELDPTGDPSAGLLSEPVPPRRWDDVALADFAGLSSTIACECPRHVAELLMQLSHFEAYSADCAHRSPADADIHAHLHRVAALSRARFEAALERVALHEGLLLPTSRRP